MPTKKKRVGFIPREDVMRIIDQLSIETEASKLQGDLRFDYKREDLKYFAEKVNITANFKDSHVELSELNTFYDEFGVNQTANLDVELSGTLNNLFAKNLKVSTTRNTQIIGDVNFKNSLSAPAIVIPGISHVSVYDVTREKVKRFLSNDFMKFSAFCLFP